MIHLALPLVLALSPALQEHLHPGGPDREYGSTELSTEALFDDLDRLVELFQTVHPAPYRVHSPEAWDEAIATCAAAIEAGLDARGFHAELQRIATLAADGHSRVLPSPAVTALMRERAYPARFRYFDEGLFLTAVPAAYGDFAGARIVSVGGRSADDLLDAMLPYTPADNPHAARRDAAVQMVFADNLGHVGFAEPDGSAVLELELGDGSRDELVLEPAPLDGDLWGPSPSDWVDVLRDAPGADALWLARMDENFWFEYLPEERTVFFQFNSVRDGQLKTIAAFAEELFAFVDENDVQRLVIDLRHNGGGNNYLVQPLVHGLIRCERLADPGRLFVLTSPQTFSAAMSFSGDIEVNTQALFVGEPTGSGPNQAGDNASFDLESSGFRALVSELWWQKTDPRDTRSFIVPDLPVPVTFVDRVEGRDAALEAVLAWEPAPTDERRPPNTRWYRPSQTGGR